MAFGAIMGQTPLVETSPLDRIGLYQILGKGSGIWTPQQLGKYLVIVIGPGGDGGRGYGNNTAINVSSGAGGGSGGIAVFELKLDNLNSYTYEITDTYSKFNNQVTCNSGENGQDGQFQKESKGGDGGNVESDIELLLKANGLSGENGKNVTLSNSELVGTPNKGASLPLVLNFPLFYGGKSGILLGTIQDSFNVKIIKAMDGTVHKESGFVYSGCVGMGADGTPSYIVSSNQFPVVLPYSKAKGGDGAIIIQYLGKD